MHTKNNTLLLVAPILQATKIILLVCVSTYSTAYAQQAPATPQATPTTSAPRPAGQAQVANPTTAKMPSAVSTLEADETKKLPLTSSVEVDELVKYGSEAAVYRAMTKKLEAQLQAMTKKAEVDKMGPAGTGNRIPTLLSVERFKDRLVAEIEVAPSVSVSVKKGGLLPNGMEVMHIESDRVILRNPLSKKLVLLLATTAAQSSSGYFEMNSSDKSISSTTARLR